MVRGKDKGEEEPRERAELVTNHALMSSIYFFLDQLPFFFRNRQFEKGTMAVVRVM